MPIACLYLGREGDPDTFHLQPNADHRCYATAPEGGIDLRQQAAHCFADCEACPRWVAPLAPGRRGRPKLRAGALGARTIPTDVAGVFPAGSPPAGSPPAGTPPAGAPAAAASGAWVRTQSAFGEEPNPIGSDFEGSASRASAGPGDAAGRRDVPGAGQDAGPGKGLRARLSRFSFEEWLVYAVTAGLLLVIGFFALFAGPAQPGDVSLPASIAGTATQRVAEGPSSTPSPVPSRMPASTREAEPEPAGTAALPRAPEGGLVAALSPSERGVGSFAEAERLPAYGERELRVGRFEGQQYLGGLLFALGKIPGRSKVSYVALELAGLSDSQTLGEGDWTVELLDPEAADDWTDLTYSTLAAAPASQMKTAWRLAAEDLAPRKVNVLEFSADARDLFMQRLDQGRIAFRIRGPAAGEGDNLFLWDSGYGEGFGTRPVLRVAFVPPPATPLPAGASADGGPAAPTDLPLMVWISEPTPAPAAPTPTPYPMGQFGSLKGMILFVSDRFAVQEGRARPAGDFKRPAGFTQPEQLMVYDPRSGRIGQVTKTWPWELGNTLGARAQDLSVWVGPSNQLMLRDKFSEAPRELIGGDGKAYYDPSVSPDAQWITFTSDRDGNDEIYVIRRDGQELRRLTTNTWEWDKHPSFSPDGSQIVFWSNREGRKQLYIINADGSELGNISNNAYNDWEPVWIR